MGQGRVRVMTRISMRHRLSHRLILGLGLGDIIVVGVGVRVVFSCLTCVRDLRVR